MTDYVSNVPVSRPNSLPGVKPDVDMNGFCWSNKHGLFFYVTKDIYSPIAPPPPAATER
jgi:hypothetical protein